MGVTSTGLKAFSQLRWAVPAAILLSWNVGAFQQREIPVVVAPPFVPAETADGFLQADDLLLGIKIEGRAKAYPIRILGLYEVVNDEVAGRAICATW